MQVIRIANAIVADTNTDFVLPNAYSAHPEAFVQIEITSTFTCQILGRLHPDATYVELIAAVTVDTIQPITYMPYLRVTTSGGASTPVCSVYVMLGNSVRV